MVHFVSTVYFMLFLTKNITSFFAKWKASFDKSVIRWSWNEEGLELVDIILTIYSPVTSMVITNDRTFIILGNIYLLLANSYFN